MNRRTASIAVAFLFSAAIPTSALAQAKPAASPPPPASPPAPAKFVPQVRGEATLEFTQTKPQRVKGEIVTKIKVKNTSKGSIGLLSVEELWYNTKREVATSGSYRHRALLNPGEIIEFTISSPEKPDLYTNMLMFKHAGGKVDPKRVPKL